MEEHRKISLIVSIICVLLFCCLYSAFLFGCEVAPKEDGYIQTIILIGNDFRDLEAYANNYIKEHRLNVVSIQYNMFDTKTYLHYDWYCTIVYKTA